MVVQSKNAFETAEISLKEYINGTFKQEEQTILGEIFVAQENLHRAEEYYRHSETLAAKGFQTALQLEADKFAIDKARTELETATTRLNVLRKYTKAKMIKQLESDIATAKAKWKSDEQSHAIDVAKLREMEEQVAKCTILAPKSGQIVYANEYSRRGGSDVIIEPGTMVREGQVIVRLPDPNQMQVKAKVNESQIALVEEGMAVEVRLDAFPEERLSGVVTRVNEYPEPTNWFNSGVRVYAAYVQIETSSSELKIKPGLTAQVRINVKTAENVIQAPVQAIKQFKGRDFCAVKVGDRWEPRELVRGATNDKFIIVEGIKEGEVVSQRPGKFLDESALKQLVATTKPPVAVEIEPPHLARRTRSNRAGQPSRQPPAGDGAQFDRIDANRDQRIVEKEAPAGLWSRIKQGDLNGDGAIDRAEWNATLAKSGAEGKSDARAVAPGDG
jgi:multidrug efflux pump subunit AcrA (membrane-fusion protein)